MFKSLLIRESDTKVNFEYFLEVQVLKMSITKFFCLLTIISKVMTKLIMQVFILKIENCFLKYDQSQKQRPFTANVTMTFSNPQPEK